MSTEFKRGYLLFAFFLIKDDPAKWMPDIYDLVKSYCEQSSSVLEMHCSKFFGRFDWVFSFGCKSAKVGLNEVCNVQSRIRDNGILSASSPILLSEIASNNRVIKNYPIESIIHVKPKDNLQFIENLNPCLHSAKTNEIRVFWNTSSYPFTLVCRGKKYSEIVDEIRNFKFLMKEHIAESSIMFSLGFKDGKLMQDEKNKLFANVYVKLRSFDLDNTLKWKGKTLLRSGGLPLDRLAYYDLCYTVEENSLYDLGEKLIEFKHNNIETVEHTSTLLLGTAGGRINGN